MAHVARTVYAYFMERFEDTPINDDLYDFFHEARFTDNFYDVRQVLKWYFFDCYLTSGRFQESTFDEALDYQMDLCRGNRQVAQSAAEASIAFRYQVGPLALKPQEWLAALLTIHGHADKALIEQVFTENKIDVVVNLAAQAGVRYSITNPDSYIESNLIGFYNILEACRHHEVEHLVYASSSSVYGSNKKIPYSTEDKVDNPVSLYAATKKSNELMAHAYSKLYNIPSTGLRFFTVYGPCGRPDMAYFGFTNKLLKGVKIQIFNYGNCKRDFTYVDDIVEGAVRVMQHAPEKQLGEDGLPVPPYTVYNIGNNQPENLLDFVQILQEELVRAGVLPEDYDFEAHKELVPMQPGDVPVTYSDTTPLEQDFGFKPSTPLREDLRKFAEWYKTYQSRI